VSGKPYAQVSPQIVLTDAEIFEAHTGGRLSVELKAPLDTRRDPSIAYTPGVAQVSRAIAADHTLATRYTWAHRHRIVPSPLDPRVAPARAAAVGAAAGD
jgi:malate dehydrogenase (oxaloacetate-decarboxylating)